MRQTSAARAAQQFELTPLPMQSRQEKATKQEGQSYISSVVEVDSFVGNRGYWLRENRNQDKKAIALRDANILSNQSELAIVTS